MQQPIVPSYVSRRDAPLPWHREIRYTLIGAAAGTIAVSLTLLFIFTQFARGSALPYLCPVTTRLLPLVSERDGVFAFLYRLIGAFFEWLIWGVLVDVGRMLVRMIPRSTDAG